MVSHQLVSDRGKNYDSVDGDSINKYSDESPDFDQLEQEYDDLKTSEIIAPHISNGHSIGSSPRHHHLYDDMHLDSIVDTTYQDEESILKGTSTGKTGIEDVTVRNIYTYDSLQVPNYEEPIVNLKDAYDEKIKPYVRLQSVTDYLLSLFPLLKWIHHYNLSWLYNDVVAGITVGCVLVPQSMSYAQIASLPPQYGLYSSFVGAFIYSFFVTLAITLAVSRDITATGPMQTSLLVAKNEYMKAPTKEEYNPY